MKSRSSRVVWITGASSGIGWTLAEVFAARGDQVIASARSVDLLRKLKHSIEAKGGRCEIARMDVRSEKNVSATARELLMRVRHIDILVNNAGITYFKEFLATTTREFDNVTNTNLRGLFLTTKGVLPSMVKRKTGLIINILS
ncbi:MAG: SDR family NAD(P)-dependent oxidoreductase, partial [Bacteroidota bacterium]